MKEKEIPQIENEKETLPEARINRSRIGGEDHRTDFD